MLNYFLIICKNNFLKLIIIMVIAIIITIIIIDIYFKQEE